MLYSLHLNMPGPVKKLKDIEGFLLFTLVLVVKEACEQAKSLENIAEFWEINLFMLCSRGKILNS